MTLDKLDGDRLIDRNPNFVLDYILSDVVAHLKNQENCSPYQMYFIRDRIVDSLIEQ
jgi:hypothetical protein